MNWRDEGGIWQRGMKTRIRRTGAVVALLVIAMVMPFFVSFYFARLPWVALGSPLPLPIVLAALFLIAAGAWALYHARRDLALMKTVPENNGRVCSKCAVVIEGTNGAGQLVCPRCGCSFQEEELHAHWRRYGISPIEPYRWLRPQHRQAVIENGSIQIEMDAKRMRRQTLWLVPLMAALTAAPMLLSARSMAWTGMAQFIAPPVMMWVAFGLIMGFAWRVIDADRRFCAVCRYEREAGAGENCPECGAPWQDDGGTIAGRIQARRGVFIAAALLLAIALAGMINIFTGATFAGRVTPTAAIINRIVTSSDPQNISHWQDLAGRTSPPIRSACSLNLCSPSTLATPLPQATPIGSPFNSQQAPSLPTCSTGSFAA